MKRLAAVGLALLALGVPGVVRGQEGEPPGPPDRRPREEAAKMVDAYIISNLQDGLGLSDEQFVKLLPLVKRLQSDRRELATKRMQAMREMRRLLEAGGSSEARVVELLKQVKAVESEEPSMIRRDLEAVDAALTPLQQAKFRVLEIEVEFKIRELMNQIRRPRRPGRRPGNEPLGPPGDAPRP